MRFGGFNLLLFNLVRRLLVGLIRFVYLDLILIKGDLLAFAFFIEILLDTLIGAEQV